MDYMGWQMNMNLPVAENVIKAMEYHAEKYGIVPNVVEYSKKLNVDQLPRFDGITIRFHHAPANILLLGCQN